MNWTISKRLGVGFGALVILSGGLGAVSIWQSLSASESSSKQAELAGMLNEIAQTKEAVLTPRVAINRLIINPSAAERAALTKAVEEADKQIDSLDSLAFEGDEQKLAKSVSEGFEKYVKAAMRVADLSQEKKDLFDNQCGPTGKRLEADARKLSEDAKAQGNAKLAAAALGFATDANAARLGIARFLVSGDEVYLTDTAEAARRMEGAINLGREAATDGVQRAAVDGLKKNLDTYVAIGTRVQALYTEFQAIRANDLNTYGAKMTADAGELAKLVVARGEAVEQAAVAAAGKSLWVAGIATTFTVIFGALAAFFMSRSITKPLNKVTTSLKDIAEGEGDLTQRVDEARKDELGELGKYFNTFVGRIQDLMKEVSATSKQVAAASTEIAASAEQMATGLDKQQAQTQQVSAAMEEMSASVVEVARKSTDACRTAEEAGSQATEGGNVVEKTVVEMKGIADQVTESARSVNNLGKKSEQIGQIISVINDIADQTNLLALNAAIEAARAGEHGRGFAVVADEVRKLAERTTTATEEVARSIREIQTDTGAAVGCIEEGTKKVQSGVQFATNAGEALRKIVQGSENVRQMVQSIAAAAEEQSAAGEQISKSVEQINAVTRESAEGAQQSSKAAAELSKQAELLERLVGRFKV